MNGVCLFALCSNKQSKRRHLFAAGFHTVVHSLLQELLTLT